MPVWLLLSTALAAASEAAAGLISMPLRRTDRKRLKFLFHLAAMSAIRVKGELQTYYQRKVAEAVPRRDKNKMSILNAVRNKLIHRIYAVVKRKQKYNIFYPLSFV